MQFDIYRRIDGALVAVPSRLGALFVPGFAPVRFIRTSTVDLDLLSDAFVSDLGLHGHAVASDADAALLRSAADRLCMSPGVE